MGKWDAAANEIFLQALEIDSPGLRSGYVDDACGSDAELRTEVESLLDAHARVGDFLLNPTASLAGDANPDSEAEPQVEIGRYKLLEEIGEGGFGVVYMAEQRRPVRRRVALKIIKPGMDTRHVIARFEAERQALAMMDHPNIARVFDGGATEHGHPYFVMELVRGIPITRYCDDAQLTTNERLELFISVCDAVHHAHQKGIIHRDLKPSNILVTLHGDTPVPKVIDFGVAKATDQVLTEKTYYTRFGEMIGTPLYMSPEQMALSGLDVDIRSDVYSLGVLLYELLCGMPPIEPQRLRDLSIEEIRRVIREEEPPKPSTRFSTVGKAATTLAKCRKIEPARLCQTLRGELDWIVMKALEKDRERRYETARHFARDVQRYLKNEPVQACPPSTMYRLKKFVRRNRPKVIAVTAVMMSLVATFVFAAVMFAIAFRNEKALRHEAQHLQLRAEESELEARKTAYVSDIMLASRAWRDGDLRQAIQLLDLQRPTGNEPDLRGFEWYYLDQLLRDRNIELADSEGAVYSVCCSPDGRSFATAGEEAALRLYDAATCDLRAKIETGQGEINGVGFSPDGQTIASAGDDGTVRVWDLATSQSLLQIKASTDELYNVLFTLDGERLITCGSESVIHIWDAQAGQSCGELDRHDAAVEAIALSPDGSLLGSAGSDRRAFLWDLASRKVVRELVGHENRLSAIAFSPDGKWIATAALDKTVRIWDVSTGAMVTMLAHLDAVQCLSFDTEGRWLATGDRGGVMRLWPESTWTLPDWNFGFAGQVRWCSISPDGKTVVAVTRERVLLRDLLTHEISELELEDPAILAETTADDRSSVCAISHSGDKVACLTEIHEKDPSSPTGWKLKARLKEDPHELTSLAFALDGSTLVTGRSDGSISFWDVETGERRVTRNAHNDRVMAIANAPDGRQFASVSCDGRLIVWDAERKPKVILMHPDSVITVAFSPVGHLIASGCRDGKIRLWDLKTGQEVGQLGKHTWQVSCLAFSSDGSLLVSSGPPDLDQTIRIWDVEKRQVQRALIGSANFVAFLHDDKTVISGGASDAIRFWNLKEGNTYSRTGSKSLKRHDGRVYSIAAACRGNQWISAGQDGKVVLSQPASFSIELEVKLHAFDLAFASGGRQLALACVGSVCLVDVSTGEPVMTIPAKESDWYAVAATPTGSLVAGASRDYVIAIWDSHTSRKQVCDSTITSEFSPGDLSISPDGTKLAVLAWEDTFCGVHLFDTASGAFLGRFPAEACHTASFSPDNSKLLVDSQNDLLVWDVASRQLVKTLRGHTSTIQATAFSPNGRLIASAGNDRMVRLWDAGSGELRCAMQGHRSDVLTLAFTPDGRSLATADEGGALKLWHVGTGRELMTLTDETVAIERIAFSPDGKHLAFVRGDQVVRLFHVPKYSFSAEGQMPIAE